MSTLSRATLPELIGVAEQNSVRVRESFGQCTPAQLAWKSRPEEWSIGQCLEHLNLATKVYFPKIRAVNTGSYRTRPVERLPLLPQLGAALLLRILDPQASIAVPAPPGVQPPELVAGPQALDDFLIMQRTLIDHMRASVGPELERRVITSPIAAIMTYSLIDAYRIIVVHELLHIQQAERVMVRQQEHMQGR